jgi:UDP-N-acetylglucosamine 2-epimerase (non-hydrolysing)
LQEETTYLGVPCLTVRSSTERPVTCQLGTNRLVPPGSDLLAAVHEVLDRPPPPRPVIDRWDGHSAERILKAIEEAGSRVAGDLGQRFDALSAAS